MFVSVIVPTYNRREDLKKTISSLLSQTYPKDRYEIIICDDSSTDGTKEMVHELKAKNQDIHYLRGNENLGDGHARNLGLKKAKGEIIAFTDDDCKPSPDWIENGVKYFESDSSLTGLQGKTLAEEKASYKKKIFFYARTVQVPEQDLNCQTCNMFYRKKDLMEVGGFDEDIRFVNDVDISARLLQKKKKIVFGKDVLVQHKIEYMPFFSYLLRMAVHQYYPLLVKKNPSIRKRLFCNFFVKKSHIYPIFFFISILFFLLQNSGEFFIYLAYINLVFFSISFFYSRIAIDHNLAAYPFRALFFFRYLLLDMTDMFFLFKGSLKYRCLVL